MTTKKSVTQRVARAVLGVFSGQREFGAAHMAGHKTLLMHLPPYARGAWMRTNCN